MTAKTKGKKPRAPRVISETAYSFIVRLKGRRSINRTIALRGDQTLDDLHEAIFNVFDRFDPHLYSFYFPKAPARRWQPGQRPPKEYTAPHMYEGPDSLGSPKRLNAATTKLDDLALKPGQTLEYLFDFGDNWWHEIAVEAVGPLDGDAGRYPRLLASRGAAPRQYPESGD